MGAGRPTDYKPEYSELVYKLCLLGAIDTEMADIIGVTEKTFNNWKKKYPEFLQSLKKGKEIADAEVGNKLFERACGYSHKAVKIFCDKGDIVTEEYIEHYPPDPTSMIFWLKNRQPNKWKDKRIQEQTGKDGEPLYNNNNLTIEFIESKQDAS
jgi:hypothetical protein